MTYSTRNPFSTTPVDTAAYLSQPAACDGARVMLRMKADLDGVASAMGVACLRYYVDSGRLDGGPAYGHALLRLVRDVRDGRFGAVLVLDRRDFAEDEAMAASALEALGRAGVLVIEVSRLTSGEAHVPAPSVGAAP